jgi:hypothetical protein
MQGSLDCARVTAHDTSVYEAYGPRDLTFQHVYGCSILGYRKSL